MPSFLAPIGLTVVTGAQRDALTSADGQLVWNSDEERVERYDDVTQLIGALAVDIGRIRSALRFLGVEPDVFDPDMH